MIVWVYIGIILLMRVVQHVFTKATSNEVPANSVGYLKYTIFYQGIAGVLAFALFGVELIKGIDNLHFGETLLYASISGVALVASCCCSLYVLSTGTMSLSAMFATAGLLVPTIASMFLYEEYLNIWQWLSIALFMIASWLLISASKSTYGKFTLKTFLILVATLVLNGLTMLMQTMFGREVIRGNVSLFSALSFGAGVVVLLVLYIICVIYSNKKFEEQGETVEKTVDFSLLPDNKKQMKLTKRTYLFALFLAVAVFLINQLATLSTPLISPVILFAFINGGSTIISAIVGAIMYKEKLSVRTIIGLVLGVGSLILLQVFA